MPKTEQNAERLILYFLEVGKKRKSTTKKYRKDRQIIIMKL